MKTLRAFLGQKGFVVMTGHGNGAEYEAWAYEGPLDLDEAVPQRFGVGGTPVQALEALDWQLTQAAKYPAAPLAETPPLASLRLDRRELATILAALRFHQEENLSSGRRRSQMTHLAIRDIATDGGTLKPLDRGEIDALCQRLNAAPDTESDPAKQRS